MVSKFVKEMNTITKQVQDGEFVITHSGSRVRRDKVVKKEAAVEAVLAKKAAEETAATEKAAIEARAAADKAVTEAKAAADKAAAEKAEV